MIGTEMRNNTGKDLETATRRHMREEALREDTMRVRCLQIQGLSWLDFCDKQISTYLHEQLYDNLSEQANQTSAIDQALLKTLKKGLYKTSRISLSRWNEFS